MKLDLLVLTVHPDDAELGCGGTILGHVAMGKKVGLVDMTRGELGTNGSPELRAEEAAAAAKILGVPVRENLGFADGFFTNDRFHQLEIVRVIRKFQPEVVIANALEDRHPDHPRAAQLAKDACFLSGLKKIETKWDGKFQEAWRPKRMYHIIQSTYIRPDLVVDITPFWEKKKKAIEAFKSQFFVPQEGTASEKTFISTPGFMQFIEGRAREFGQQVGVQYAEGFASSHIPLVKSLFDISM
jgi:N-acetylglucosamine malate deacetylase 1